MSLEHDIDKFLKEQAEPTPEKKATPPEEVVSNKNEVNLSDFDKFEDELESKDLDETHAPVLKIDPNREAKNGVVLIDVTQKLLFTGLYKAKGSKKAGGKDSWNEAIALMDDIQTEAKNKNDLTPQQKKAIIHVNRTLKKIKRLELSEDEKEIWMDAIIPLIENNGYQIPTSMLIIVAIINTLAPRVTDLIID